jgi:protein involved in polysaccharide export with SLBB domain
MNLRRNYLSLAGAILAAPDWVRTARQAVLAFIIGVVGAACPTWAQQTENYRLAPNDVLYFGIFGEPDTIAEVRIAGDGTGNFPFLKSVRIGGLTVAQATETLRQAYIQQEYFVNPQVNLGVRTYAKRVFTVLGQVQKPGSYEIVGNESVSLLGAVGMAGGYTRIANRGAITVRRAEGGQEQRIRLDGRDGASGASGPDFQIHPGDVITVGESIF